MRRTPRTPASSDSRVRRAQVNPCGCTGEEGGLGSEAQVSFDGRRFWRPMDKGVASRAPRRTTCARAQADEALGPARSCRAQAGRKERPTDCGCITPHGCGAREREVGFGVLGEGWYEGYVVLVAVWRNVVWLLECVCVWRRCGERPSLRRRKKRNDSLETPFFFRGSFSSFTLRHIDPVLLKNHTPLASCQSQSRARAAKQAPSPRARFRFVTMRRRRRG